MLKWTLRAPGDNISCPPSPPEATSPKTNKSEVKGRLEDSNKCWTETKVSDEKSPRISRCKVFCSGQSR